MSEFMYALCVVLAWLMVGGVVTGMYRAIVPPDEESDVPVVNFFLVWFWPVTFAFLWQKMVYDFVLLRMEYRKAQKKRLEELRKTNKEAEEEARREFDGLMVPTGRKEHTNGR